MTSRNKAQRLRIENRASDFDMPQEELVTEDALSEQPLEMGFSSFRQRVHRPKKTTNLKKKRKPDWYEPQTLNPEPSSPFPRGHPRSSARLPCPTSDVVIKSAIPTYSMFVPSADYKLDYLSVFISHARLYVFADTWGVQDLQKLTARRLDEALDQFQYSLGSATSTTELMQYICDSTFDCEDEVDILRRVVINFAANNI